MLHGHAFVRERCLSGVLDYCNVDWLSPRIVVAHAVKEAYGGTGQNLWFGGLHEGGRRLDIDLLGGQ